MEVSRRKLAATSVDALDCVDPFLALGTVGIRRALYCRTARHTRPALGDVVLDRAGDAPGRVVGDRRVVAGIVGLHPEANLEVVLQGLVRPRDLLVGVEQVPSVAAGIEPADVPAQYSRMSESSHTGQTRRMRLS